MRFQRGQHAAPEELVAVDEVVELPALAGIERDQPGTAAQMAATPSSATWRCPVVTVMEMRFEDTTTSC